MSQARPTGYDNRDRATGAPVAEVYLYDAAAGKLRCASCDPTGARPTGFDYFQLEPGSGGLVGGGRGTWLLHGLVAGDRPRLDPDPLGRAGHFPSTSPPTSPTPAASSSTPATPSSPRTQTAPSTSTSTSPPRAPASPPPTAAPPPRPTYSSRSGGCVGLISAGTSGQESAFIGASESGDDVFFLTSSQLVKQDVDTARDVYDAHACSAAVPCLPEPPPPAPACEGDACQQPATPPNDQTPGSLTFKAPATSSNARRARSRRAASASRSTRPRSTTRRRVSTTSAPTAEPPVTTAEVKSERHQGTPTDRPHRDQGESRRDFASPAYPSPYVLFAPCCLRQPLRRGGAVPSRQVRSRGAPRRAGQGRRERE